jgi:hypothetical protein
VFTLTGLLVLLPLVFARDYWGRIRRLPPASQVFEKTALGAGMLALGAWAYCVRALEIITGVWAWSRLPLPLTARRPFFVFAGKGPKERLADPAEDNLQSASLIRGHRFRV